jgi:hypothetical protein
VLPSSSLGSKNSYHPPLYEDEEQILVVAPTLLKSTWSSQQQQQPQRHLRHRHKHQQQHRRRHDEDEQDDEEEEDHGLLHHSKRRATNKWHRPTVVPDDDDDDAMVQQKRNDPQLLFPIRPKVLRPVAMRVAMPPPILQDDQEEEDHQDHDDDGMPRYYRRHSSQQQQQQDVWSAIVNPIQIPKHVVMVLDHRSSPSSPLSLPTIHSGMQDDHDERRPSMTDMMVRLDQPFVNVIEEDEDQEQQGVVVLEYPSQQLQHPSMSLSRTSSSFSVLPPELQAARDDILQALALSGGEVNDPKFLQALEPLVQYYATTQHDTRPLVVVVESDNSSDPRLLRVEGMWLSLSKPTFFGNLGENDQGDPMYTLGRMAFDMYAPAQLVCSLQGSFNPVSVVPPLGVGCGENENDEGDAASQQQQQQHAIRDGLPVPKKFQEEVASGTSVLRTYK